MTNAREAVAMLEISMHDHYTDYEGLHSCDGLTYDGKETTCTGTCTCGASDANERIEKVIQFIKESALWNAE